MKNRDTPALKKVMRIDCIPISETFIDEDGFLHDTPIVTSTGIFEYSLPDGGARRELRLPEHVFDKESLASYLGRPIIITHSAGAITKENVKDEIVGTILSAGYQDGDDVRCKIIIHDMDTVKKTPYRELSLGYNLDLIEEPGIWNGQPYDAIQTNIRINHLAIVESARAGEQAHLNLDGKKVELDDKKSKGGNREMDANNARKDSVALTPEELDEAIRQYKAGAAPEEGAAPGSAGDDGIEAEVLPEEQDGAGVDEPAVAASAEEASGIGESPVQEENKGDGDTGKLIGLLEEFLTKLKSSAGGSEAQDGIGTDAAYGNSDADSADGECTDAEDNADCSNDMSGSMNNDSADEIFRQRLSICRIGDKLRMDGLENKSILEGKKAIIAKVLPDMRLDGKSRAYVDAAYDMAVNEVNKRKDVSFQKKQMAGKPAPAQETRADGNPAGKSAAAQARQRMIDREGGKQ